MALGAWPTRLGTLHPPLGLSAPTSRLPRGSLTDEVPVTRAGSLPCRAAGGLGGSRQWEKGKPPPSRKAPTTQHHLPPPHTPPLPATSMQPEGEGPVGRPGQPLPSLGGRQRLGLATAGAGGSGGRTAKLLALVAAQVTRSSGRWGRLPGRLPLLLGCVPPPSTFRVHWQRPGVGTLSISAPYPSVFPKLPQPRICLRYDSTYQ